MTDTTLPDPSPEQEEILTLIQKGRNVLVTGSAGTGKSTLLKHLDERMEGKLPVCASTGIAAVQVGGLTLHSWAGLGLADQSAEDTAANMGGAARKRIKAAKILAIDEISMIDAKLFDMLDTVFQTIRNKRLPFGGVQLVLFGDFLQLPPVSKSGWSGFAFESRAWGSARIETRVLRKVWRQADQVFVDILNELRIGDPDGVAEALLRTRLNPDDPAPEIRAVEIHTHNKAVDEENERQLRALVGPIITHKAGSSGDPYKQKALRKNCLAPEELRLRKGAQVMLLWNVAPLEGLANGSIGVIESFAKGTNFPTVKFSNGERREIGLKRWQTKVGDDVLAEYVQVPLRLAYAVTVHKSQGMTLDKIRVHLRRSFEHGQAYVALSRARTLEGLFIESIGEIKAHPSAVEFYRNATL